MSPPPCANKTCLQGRSSEDGIEKPIMTAMMTKGMMTKGIMMKHGMMKHVMMKHGMLTPCMVFPCCAAVLSPLCVALALSSQ